MFCVTSFSQSCRYPFVFRVVLVFSKTRQAIKVQGQVCVFNAVLIFEYGLYIFSVTCMLCAHDAGVQFAIAVFEKQEEYTDGSVFVMQCDFLNTDCISFVSHVCCVLMMLVYNSR